MQDLETNTLWSHVTGEAISGKLKGQHLATIPVVQTSWHEWLRRHPETKILKKEKQIRSSHYEKYFSDPNRTGLFRTYWLQDRMPGKRLIYGIALGPHALAVTASKLDSIGFLTTKLGDESVVIVRASDGGVRAYLAKVDHQDLTFDRDSNRRVYLDTKTNSSWEMDKGFCIDGKLKGSRLKPLFITPAFWFAWSTFYPNTRVMD